MLPVAASSTTASAASEYATPTLLSSENELSFAPVAVQPVVAAQTSASAANHPAFDFVLLAMAILLLSTSVATAAIVASPAPGREGRKGIIRERTWIADRRCCARSVSARRYPSDKLIHVCP